MSETYELRLIMRRNRFLVRVVALAFFLTVIASGAVSYAMLLTANGLVSDFEGMIGPAQSYVAIPPPYSKGLYSFIFLNNIGHFWNPVRMGAWLPFIGAFSLGIELLLNAIVIGAVASFSGLTRGFTFTVAGLAPHGVVELPAFILEFAGMARWHVTTTQAIHAKLSGRNIDRPLLVGGIKDAAVLSLLSVALFAIAALIETYVTPGLLGMSG